MLERRRTDPAATREVARHAEEYYPAYRDGYLLEDGGWAHQSARYADYMLELRTLEDQIDRKYLDLTAPKEDSA